MTAVDDERADGRKARRDRGRLAVLDAMVDLVREGHSPPSTEAVADRAGVSIASLFRYFPSVEEMQQQTTARFFERYDSLLDIPDLGAGTLADRIEGYVSSRITLYETIGPIARFARAQSFERPHLATSLSALRHRHVASTRKHFATELRPRTASARDDRVFVITSLTSFESWDLLHTDLDRSRVQIHRAWSWAIRTSLD